MKTIHRAPLAARVIASLLGLPLHTGEALPSWRAGARHREEADTLARKCATLEAQNAALLSALESATAKLHRCAVASGTDPEFADGLVAEYRAAIAAAKAKP